MPLTCPQCGTELMYIPQGRDAYRISCPNGIKSPLCDQVDGVIVPCEPNVEMLEALYGGMHCAGDGQAKMALLIEDNERLRALIAEIDKRTMFEAHGMGNTFADSIECLTQHGGRCPTVQEAYAGALLCEQHKST